MGQVNLTLAAREVLRDGGSITLIAGVLADEPIVAGSWRAWSTGRWRVSCAPRRSNCRAGFASTSSARRCSRNRWTATGRSSAASIRCPWLAPRAPSAAASRAGRPAKCTRCCGALARWLAALLALTALTMAAFALWPGSISPSRMRSTTRRLIGRDGLATLGRHPSSAPHAVHRSSPLSQRSTVFRRFGVAVPYAPSGRGLLFLAVTMALGARPDRQPRPQGSRASAASGSRRWNSAAAKSSARGIASTGPA